MLVEINNLHIGFESRTGFAPAVKGVSLKLGTEKLGIVGESGSGKSLTARALMKLLPKHTRIEADKLAFDGIDILSASEKQMRTIRGKRAGFILQDPKYSLDPVMSIGRQIVETLRTHERVSKAEARERALAMLEAVPAGPEFDAAFVRHMIPHHQAGIVEFLEPQSRAPHAELRVSASEGITAQAAQVADFRTWLSARSG